MKTPVSRTHWVALIASLMLGLAGCSTDFIGNADGGGKDANNKDAGSADKGSADSKAKKDLGALEAGPDTGSQDAAGTLSIPVRFTDFLSNSSLQGVYACVKEEATVPCQTSDPLGKVTMTGIPMWKDLTMTFKKSLYLDSHSPVNKLPNTTSYDVPLLSTSGAMVLAKAAGTAVKSGNGHVLFFAENVTNPQPNITFTVLSGAGEGPFYFNTSGNIDKTLTYTSTWGYALLLNITPSIYSVKWSHPSKTCEIQYGWNATAKDTMTLQVVKDTVTVVSVYCQ